MFDHKKKNQQLYAQVVERTEIRDVRKLTEESAHQNTTDFGNSPV